MDQFIVLNVIAKDGTIRPTNFVLHDLTFLRKNSKEPGVRQVRSGHPFGTHNVRLDDGDTLQVLSEPDPSAASLR